MFLRLKNYFTDMMQTTEPKYEIKCTNNVMVQE